MRRASFVVLFPLLAACVGSGAREELPPPQLPERAGVDPLVAARAEGVELRAVGEGVVLDIFADRIRLIVTATGDELVFPKPEPILPRWNGSIYETSHAGRRLRVEIENYRPCELPSRFTYLVSVNIVLDGQTIAACGREFARTD